MYFFRCLGGVFVLGCMLGLYACQGSSQPQGQELVMNKCVSCHSNQITCINLGRDQAYWEDTVARMVDKGMEMPTEEQTVVSEYLAGLDSGAAPVCK
ncbi:MAG: hypothetical protein R6V55_06975 [Desulfovermiculus sp.]